MFHNLDKYTSSSKHLTGASQMSFPPRVSFVLHKSCRRPSDIIYIFCLNSTFQILSTFWPRFILIFLVKYIYGIIAMMMIGGARVTQCVKEQSRTQQWAPIWQSHNIVIHQNEWFSINKHASLKAVLVWNSGYPLTDPMTG